MDLPGPDSATWNGLAAKTRNIFLTRDFAQSWWSAYRPRGTPMILTDHPERPRCLLPLYRSPGPVPLIRQIGHGPADELGPLCAPEDQERAADLIRDELAQGLRRGVLVMHDASVHDLFIDRLDGQVVRTTPSPAVRLDPGSWHDFLAAHSTSFRKWVRRYRARLERNFDVTIRTSTSETLEEDTATLLRLHRLRWGDDAPFATGKSADLVRRFTRSALERDWLRLVLLELDGRPAAADLGLRFGGVHSVWQGGWDPAYERFSVGSVLMTDALRTAVEDGVSEFRLLRGAEAYKQRLANVDRTTRTVAFAEGWVGNTMVRVARARRRAGLPRAGME